MCHIGIADHLFEDVGGRLRHFRGKDATNHQFSFPRRITVLRKEPAGNDTAAILVPVGTFRVAGVVEPGGQEDDLGLITIEL